jgi:hypothetical protein
MGDKDQENKLILLKNIAEALLNMEKDFRASFGPDGAIPKQLRSIEQVLGTIAVNIKK